MEFSHHTFHIWDYISIPFCIRKSYVIVRIVDVVVISVIPAVCTSLIATFINKASEIFTNDAEKTSILLPVILILVFLMAQHLNDAIINLVNQKYNVLAKEVLEKALLKKRASLSYKYIENADTWDLTTRVCGTFTAKVNEGFRTILTFVSQIIYIASLLFIIMRYVWWAGLFLLVICIPLILYAKRAGRENYNAYVEADKIDRKADYLNNVLTGKDDAPERTLFQYKNRLQTQWTEWENEARKLVLKAQLMHIAKMKVGSILACIVTIFIITAFIVQFLNGSISAGALIAIVSAMISLIPIFSWNLSDSMMKIEECKSSLKDMTVFFGLKEETALSKLDELPIEMTEIRFEHLSFKYPNTDRYILKDFCFTFQKGTHYAIVGLNGSGKTTLIKLMLGLYDSFEGDIMIDQKPIRTLSRTQINSVFSVVFQDFAKYNIELNENILLGCSKPSDTSYQKILQSLEIDRLLEKLPDGAHTMLGKIYEDGVDISGGEWQKLAIARAILKDSVVKILDEPTAALDPSAEQSIYEMFQKECAHDTTIVITHRLGAAKSADIILVLANGSVQEIGNHDTLIAKNGLYCEMYQMQKRWYD